MSQWNIQLSGPTSWVGEVWRDPGLSAGAKYICLGLALHASEDTMAWPGKAELARRSGLTATQVEKALKDARAAGYLRSVRRHTETLFYMTTPQESKGYPKDDGDMKVHLTLSPEDALKVREIIDPDGMIGEVIAVFSRGESDD